jgi:hypothetical protein
MKDPVTTLQVEHSIANTNTINADAKVLRLSRPSSSNIRWDNFAQFNLGSYAVNPSSTTSAFTRLDLALNNIDLSGTTNVMTWQANGRVGINNTAPDAPLVVQGANETGVLKLISPSNAGDVKWWMGFGHGSTSIDANDRARIGVDIVGGGAGRLFFTTGAPGVQTTAMFIDESQRVGIGTSTPTERLAVVGNIAASGTVSASGTTLTSDARLKSNVVGINNGLSKIMSLRPVNYDKKFDLDSAGSVNEHGFIAQELQKIMPELVTEGKDKDKLLSINYTAVIPVLTKAIQEQQDTIQKQQEQIDELKALLMKLLNDK